MGAEKQYIHLSIFCIMYPFCKEDLIGLRNKANGQTLPYNKANLFKGRRTLKEA